MTLCECEVGVRYYAKLQIKPLGSSLCFLRFLVFAIFFVLPLVSHALLITDYSSLTSTFFVLMHYLSRLTSHVLHITYSH